MSNTNTIKSYPTLKFINKINQQIKKKNPLIVKLTNNNKIKRNYNYKIKNRNKKSIIKYL